MIKSSRNITSHFARTMDSSNLCNSNVLTGKTFFLEEFNLVIKITFKTRVIQQFPKEEKRTMDFCRKYLKAIRSFTFHDIEHILEHVDLPRPTLCDKIIARSILDRFEISKSQPKDRDSYSQFRGKSFFF